MKLPEEPAAWRYEPATDLNEPIGRRWASPRREPGLISWACCGTSRLVTRSYLKVAHRLRVEGCAHLPSDSPAVIVANHSSHLDAPALVAALPRTLRRSAYPVAAADYFFRDIRRSILAALLIGALPVRRGKAARHELADLRRRLTNGETLILFPEGTRSIDGRLGEFQPGLGMLVAGLDVPVIPAAILGAHAAWPKGGRLPRPTRLLVRFGVAAHFADAENRRTGWESITATCHERVRALLDSP
jgi:1-acyl-sn-glycerol-3-phosphate acyltransferase